VNKIYIFNNRLYTKKTQYISRVIMKAFLSYSYFDLSQYHVDIASRHEGFLQ